MPSTANLLNIHQNVVHSWKTEGEASLAFVSSRARNCLKFFFLLSCSPFCFFRRKSDPATSTKDCCEWGGGSERFFLFILLIPLVLQYITIHYHKEHKAEWNECQYYSNHADSSPFSFGEPFFCAPFV